MILVIDIAAKFLLELFTAQRTIQYAQAKGITLLIMMDFYIFTLSCK